MARNTTMPDPGRSVVVIDDEPLLLRGVAQLLRNAGHSVRAFASAREALVEIERSPPDVVVTDARMPEMDGLELARELRARARRSIAIVLATGTAHTIGPEERALFDFVLEKPFHARQLASAIRVATSQTAASGEMARIEIEGLARSDVRRG